MAQDIHDANHPQEIADLLKENGLSPIHLRIRTVSKCQVWFLWDSGFHSFTQSLKSSMLKGINSLIVKNLEKSQRQGQPPKVYRQKGHVARHAQPSQVKKLKITVGKCISSLQQSRVIESSSSRCRQILCRGEVYHRSVEDFHGNCRHISAHMSWLYRLGMPPITRNSLAA